MMRLVSFVVVLLAAAVALAARVPAKLVGSWYAGAGFTTAPYDSRTGTWGTPTGKGLIYVFRADGTYTKAFQSYVSNGSCTTGFTAFESGRMEVDQTTLHLTPREGKISYRDTCVPSLNSDKPLRDLKNETLSFSLGDAPRSLRLANLTGAASTFRPI